MRTRPLTENEINLLKSSTELLVHQCMIEFLYRSGYRISEMLGMKLKDIVNEKGDVKSYVNVPQNRMKGKEAARSIPIHESARKLIAEYLKVRQSDNPFLWLTPLGNTVRRQHFHYTLKEAAIKAGIEPDRVASHSFRKTFAKGIFERSGNSLQLTQKALGHKAITSTIAYLEVDTNMVDSLIRDY
jgi:site-specific recombinase XerD